MRGGERGGAGVLAFAGAFVVCVLGQLLGAADARADEEAARPYFTLGLPFLFTALVSDTVQWGVIGTTSTTAHWAWHLLPGAGPIVGLAAFSDAHCSSIRHEPQCDTPTALIQSTEVLYFASEVAGVALVAVGLVKRSQPRFAPVAPADLSWAPRLQVTPDGARAGVIVAF